MLPLPFQTIVPFLNNQDMKKIMIFSIAVFALASCKKDYTCECTTNSTYNGVGDDPTTQTVILKDVTKSTVDNAFDCVSYEGTYTDQSGDVSTYTTECTVTKN